MMRLLNSLLRPRVSRKAHNLIWSVRHEDRQPYAVFRARAEVNRFLNAPKDFRREVEAPGHAGLEAPHVQLAMEAQALAFRGDHDAAAERVRDALRALPLPASLKDLAARNAAEIHLLGQTFINEQLIRSGKGELVEVTGEQQDGAAPPVPFIDYMRAVHLAHRQRFDEAFAVVAEFDKLFPRHTPVHHADFATSLAALFVDFDTLLAPGERTHLRMRLLGKALAAFDLADPENELSQEWRIALRYWKAIVLSHKAKVDPDATCDEAMALYSQADGLMREAEALDSATPWRPAIEAARQQLLNDAALVGIDNGRAELAQLRLLGFRNLPDKEVPEAPLGWQWLLETWTDNRDPEAVELVARGLARLSEQFEVKPQQTDGRPLVLEVSDSMIISGTQPPDGTEKSRPDDLLGPETDDEALDRDVPSVKSLRKYMEDRYGLGRAGHLQGL
jgi:hypothetical protein